MYTRLSDHGPLIDGCLHDRRYLNMLTADHPLHHYCSGLVDYAILTDSCMIKQSIQAQGLSGGVI